MRRLALVAVTLVTALGVLVPPASAGITGTVVVADPKGDGVGPGDIRAVRISQASTGVAIRIRTERPLAVETAPAWTSPSARSIIRVRLDSDEARPGDEHIVLLDSDSGGVTAGIDDLVDPMAHPEAPCVTFDQVNPTLLQLKVAYGCFDLGHSGRIRVFARYWFDQGGNGTIDSGDRGPNAGYTERLLLVG
jgi:hypothetical protein